MFTSVSLHMQVDFTAYTYMSLRKVTKIKYHNMIFNMNDSEMFILFGN